MTPPTPPSGTGASLTEEEIARVARAIGESLGHTHFKTSRYRPEALAAVAALPDRLLQPAPPPARDAWLPMESAPKSTSINTPHGIHVRGVYLLGFCPEEALDMSGCIAVIWWEPHLFGDNKGGWSADNGEVEPTHWQLLPPPPLKSQPPSQGDGEP